MGWEEAAALLATALGLFLRAWLLPRLGDFDFDEVASVWYARFDPGEIVRAVADAPFEHPPLFYLVLHYWNSVFGETEPLVRMLSVPAGVLTVPATYALGRRVFSARIGAMAAFIVAASPALIFYSREARMYGYATLFGVLALYLFIRAFDEGGWLTWALFGAAIIVGAYFDYSALYAVAAVDAYLLFSWRRSPRAALAVLASQALLLAALAPWVVSSRGLAGSLPAWATGHLTFGLLSHTARLGWLDMTVGLEGIRGGRASIAVAAALGSFALAGLLLAAWRRRAGLLHAYVAAAATGLLILLLFDKEYQPRYLMMGIPPLAIFAAYLALRLPLRAWLVWALVLVLFVAGPLYASRFYYGGYVRGDYRAITSTIEALALPAPEGRGPLKFRDAVVLAGPWQGWFWRHYFPDFLEKVDVWFIPDVVPPAATPEEVDAKLTLAAKNHRRLWVVLSALKQSDPNGLVSRWLNTHLWRTRDAAYRNGALQLYLTGRAGMVIRQGGRYLAPGGPMVGTIEFAGARKDQPPQQAGDGVPFTFRMLARGPMNWDMVVRVSLVGPDSRVYAREFIPLAVDGRPPTAWTERESIVARIGVWLPAGATPGRYEAYASFLSAEGALLTLEGGIEGVFQDTPGILRLGPVQVVPSSAELPDDTEIERVYGAPIHQR